MKPAHQKHRQFNIVEESKRERTKQPTYISVYKILIRLITKFQLVKITQ